MIKCLLNDCEFDMLWDTGAKVSIITVELCEGRLDTNLHLTAVNYQH